MNKILHLSIAGFVIKLVFHRSSDKQNKVTPQNFVRDILMNNEGFILKKEPPSTDFIIEFLEAKGFDIYENQKKNGFIHFYSPVSYNHISTFYHISRVQFLYILKSAIGGLLKKKGAVIHCAANLVGDQAVLYIGKSGIGKTTITSMLKEEYPILADDEGYLKKENKKVYFYQGPFLERSYGFTKTFRRFEISTLFFLKQGNTCSVGEPAGKALTDISSQIISSETSSDNAIRLVSEMTKTINCLELVFSKNKAELMNCILNHPPFNNASSLNAK